MITIWIWKTDLNGELTNPDSIHFTDSLKYYTVRKHRLVYGGGGVMPIILYH